VLRQQVGRSGLTLAVLAVLVAGGRVHAVAAGAVGGGAVGLRRGKAVHGLDGGLGRPLAAAGAVGWRRVQGTVERREVELRL